jgi:hypothetical protein
MVLLYGIIRLPLSKAFRPKDEEIEMDTNEVNKPVKVRIENPYANTLDAMTDVGSNLRMGVVALILTPILILLAATCGQ